METLSPERIDANPSSIEMPDRVLEQEEERQLVLRALAKLTPIHRQVLTFYYGDRARTYLQKAFDYLEKEEIAAAQPTLVAEILRNVDTQFTELANEPLVQKLRESK